MPPLLLRDTACRIDIDAPGCTASGRAEDKLVTGPTVTAGDGLQTLSGNSQDACPRSKAGQYPSGRNGGRRGIGGLEGQIGGIEHHVLFVAEIADHDELECCRRRPGAARVSGNRGSTSGAALTVTVMSAGAETSRPSSASNWKSAVPVKPAAGTKVTVWPSGFKVAVPLSAPTMRKNSGIALRIGGLRRQVELDRQDRHGSRPCRRDHRRLGRLEAIVGGHQLHVGGVDDAVAVGVGRGNVAWLPGGRADQTGDQDVPSCPLTSPSWLASPAMNTCSV